MTKRFCLFLFAVSTTAFATDQNDSWRGSVRTKLQTDNRYNMEDGDYTGEVWGTLVYNNPNQKFNANFSAVSRLSTDIYRDRQQFYQAYGEKNFDFLPVTLRGGRFEKSDNLGLYLVDGATAKYQVSTPLSFEIYGGRPLQVDHVQSLRGNLVAGIESALNLTPNFSTPWLKVEKTDFRLEMQAVQRNETFLQDVIQPVLKTENNASEITEESAINPEFNLLTPAFNESLVNEHFDLIETPTCCEATTVENQQPTNANFDVLGMLTQTNAQKTQFNDLSLQRGNAFDR
jgi:hypothetical protein